MSPRRLKSKGETPTAALRNADPEEIDPGDAQRYTALQGEPKFAERAPIGYTPHLAQQVFHAVSREEGVEVTCADAGRQSGKSEGGAADTAAKNEEIYIEKRTGTGRFEGRPPQALPAASGKYVEPFVHAMVVAPSHFHLKPIRRKLQRMLGLAKRGGSITYQAADGSHFWLLGQRLIDFRCADRPMSLVGDTLDDIWLDECARMKPEAWSQNLQAALAAKQATARLTSTPLGRGTWWHRAYALGDPVEAAFIREETGEDFWPRADYRSVHWTSMDNTAIPGFRERVLRDRGRMPDAMWKQNYLASWDAFLGQIFALDRARHFRKVLPNVTGLKHVCGGMDLGQNSAAALSTWGLTRDDLFHELDTISRRATPYDRAQAWARRDMGDTSCWTTIAYQVFKRWTQHMPWNGRGIQPWQRVPLYIPSDSGGPEVRRQFRERGFNVQNAFQKSGSQHQRLVWFLEAFENDRAKVSSGVLWRSISSLVWDEGKRSLRTGEVWDKTKGVDHPWDAGGYALSQFIEHGLDSLHEPAGLMNSWG